MNIATLLLKVINEQDENLPTSEQIAYVVKEVLDQFKDDPIKATTELYNVLITRFKLTSSQLELLRSQINLAVTLYLSTNLPENSNFPFNIGDLVTADQGHKFSGKAMIIKYVTEDQVGVTVEGMPGIYNINKSNIKEY